MLIGTTGRLFVAAVTVLALATVVGIVALWPAERLEAPLALQRVDTLAAEVVAVAAEPCRVPGNQGCRLVTMRLEADGERDRPAGPLRGQSATAGGR
jgi:hypothetical protein